MELGKKRSIAAEVHCADYASFAVAMGVSDADDDEVYSWGTDLQDVLGRLTTASSAAHQPSLIGFTDRKEPFKVKTMSVGATHAAIVTTNLNVYVWGDNSYGQLGLDHTEPCHTPVINTIIASDDGSEPDRVICGKAFSFLISGQNEIMVCGRLPFTV